MRNFIESLDEKSSQYVLDAMESHQEDEDYLANIALSALEAIKDTDINLTKKEKNKMQSDYYREQGNKVYNNGYLQKALIFYNRALAYAPNDSLALKLAYSNRSAVLFSAELYKACEKDCTIALGIDCEAPKHLYDKIRRRKFQALAQLRKGDNLAQHNENIRRSADDFYKLKTRNRYIPCASSDIDVIMESGIPKIKAKREIAPGTLVALEKAFVSWAPVDPDQYYSCYYCRKLDLNLFPCSGCVAALFCSKECQETCMTEYHSVECQVIGNLMQIDTETRWLIRPIIKLKNMLGTWENLIEVSSELGENRMKKDTLSEIFDGKNPKSVLSFNNVCHFTHGAIYEKSYLCAMLLKNLLNLEKFFPSNEEDKLVAIKAFAKITMHLSLYSLTTPLVLITDVNDSDFVGSHTNGHRGLFPFVGKLKHCCVPNLQKVTINNSVALFSSKTIKAGTELTVTHTFHWLENDNISKSERKMNIYRELHTTCTCFICSSTAKEKKKMNREARISDSLRKAVVDSLNVELTIVFGTPVRKCFEQMYHLVSSLHDVPYTDEYEVVYKRLGCLHAYVLNKVLNNVVLGLDM